MTEAAALAFPENHAASARAVNMAPGGGPYAVLWNYDHLVEALNERRVELELSCEELDQRAGLPEHYSGKALGPSQSAKLGPVSLFKLVPALGLRVVLEIDPNATAAIVEQREPRCVNHARPGNFSQKCGKRTMDRALRALAVMSWPEVLKAIGAARGAVRAEQAARQRARRCRRRAPSFSLRPKRR